MSDRSAEVALGRPLLARHVTMISIGGIIGSGLFVGSSAAIAATGPAIVVSYALAGVLILLIMPMLGDMVTAHPEAGPFTQHVRRILGDGAGFVCGWLYWLFWVLAIALEGLAAASIVATYVAIPGWLIGLIFIAGMTVLNALSTRTFGEAEFWLSAAKVAAIVLFVCLAAYAVAGQVVATGDWPANLYVHGGFAPFGSMSVWSGVTAVILALVGAEIVTVAAAESKDGGRAVARLVTTLIVRVALFYIVSMLLIVSIVPWTDVHAGDSPFALALQAIGAPQASVLMNVVIVVAALSCMNSGIYVCSRVLRSLALSGEAPARMSELGGRGVPTNAILAGSACATLAVVASVLSPDRIFAVLVNATGMVMLIVYVMLVLAHIRFARRGGPVRISPIVDYVVIAAMALVVVAMLRTPALSSQAVAGLATTALLGLLYRVRRLPRANLISNWVAPEGAKPHEQRPND